MSQVKSDINSEDMEATVEVHQNALDDLVNVNTLFTAVFNIEGNKQCEAGVRVARRLVKNEVISFACYLFSSLVAKSLKTHLFTYLLSQHTLEKINCKSSKGLRGTLFALSTSTSVIGGVLLLYSMVDMIQLRLGKIACKGTETLNAVGALMAVNILALVIYIPFVSHAIYKFTKIFDKLQEKQKLSNEN
ncbi:hypothetical protein ACJRO7_000021 [Eucalyptus globulus]|uniref:Uncharacterized protein n=1 Tax=Eucalyptus globulus TaxID=34317 RepID=A0ABD3LL74_EUCGL